MINEISIIPVTMENFENKYIHLIADLFNLYKGKMQNPELKQVLERCCVTSLPDLNADTLICGINPSYNNKCPENFKFSDLKNAPYFSTLHDIISDCKSKDSIEYIDLFCFRHTDQKIIWQFTEDPIGLEFIVEHLKITQQIIEEMHPKTILVFNRTAAIFFGVNANPNADEPEKRNIWMGYKFSGINADKYSELKDLPNVEVKKIV
ncbi:MAG: hypothetical protein JXR53_15515, partial [Bacteroidales bacterium]|nr:hypothetical protein [Bacteroidales bacterium]